MRKTSIVLLFLIILLIIIGGVFWWKASKEEIKGSPDDYIIKESNEGKIVENSKAGLKFRVPEGWKVEKVEIDEGSVVLYSPDAESVYPKGRIRPPLKRGCMIEVAVGYRKTSFEELEREIKKIHAGLAIKKDEIREIKLHNISALENRFDCIELGESINIYPIVRDRLYTVSLSFSSQSEKECLRLLEEFLDTLSFE